MGKKDKPTSGITVAEAGRKGGNKLLAQRGVEFFREIGRKGGEATKASQGPDFYEAIGKKGGSKGGESTRDKHGHEHYEQIGRLGGMKVKAIIEAGKAALAAKEAEKP